jgi:hypothetical protein
VVFLFGVPPSAQRERVPICIIVSVWCSVDASTYWVQTVVWIVTYPWENEFAKMKVVTACVTFQSWWVCVCVS